MPSELAPRRSRLRRAALVLGVGALSAGLVTSTAQTASAFGSGQSLATNNAWIVAELAGQGATGLVQDAKTPGQLDPTYDTRTITGSSRTTPTAVSKPTGWLSKVPKRGPAGAILSGGSVLLDLGGLLFGGDSFLAGDGTPVGPTAGGGSFEPVAVATQYGTVTLTGSPVGKDSVELFITYAPANGSEGPNLVAAYEVWSAQTRTLAATGSTGTGNSPGTRSIGVVNVPGGDVSDARLIVQWAGTTIGDRTSPGTPAGAGGAPAASSIVTRIECRNATGETSVVSSSTSAVIAPGREISPADARCPAGTVAVSGGVTATDAAGTVTELVPTTQAPPWVGTLPQQAPGCTLAGAVCQLDVQTQTGSETTWTSCTAAPSRCAEWETAPAGSPSRYRCLWGGYPVDLARCSGITYAPGRAPQVTQPYPSPRPDPANPAQPVPEPAPNPRPSPNPGPEPMPRPDDVASDRSEKCPPDFGITSLLSPWWAWKATTCALSWAFVPSQPIGQIMAPALAGVRSVPPASWFTQLTTAVAPPGATGPGGISVPAVSGCPDWTVQIGDHTTDNITCDSAFNRLIASSRPILLGLMTVAAFAPFLRSLFYAVMPFVRPTPTS